MIAVLCVALFVALVPPARPAAARSHSAATIPASDFVLSWTDSTKPVVIKQGELIGTANFELQNNGAVAHTYVIYTSVRPSGWRRTISPSSTVTVQPGSSNKLKIAVLMTIPADTLTGTYNLTLSAAKQDGNPPGDTEQADAPFLVKVTNADGTGGGGPPACPEVKDPGGDLDSASLILVDREETHGICTGGDEDWFKFGGVANKVYTLEVTSMDSGLDLAIELFDDHGRFIDGSDDSPSIAKLNNTKPLIQTFYAPYSGFYYVRIHDTLGLGGNAGYKFVVRGQSFGSVPGRIPPNPATCNDVYEQDGLPELANLIISNETQKGRLLCPVGDADWIKFFGLKGYVYAITTSTKGYNPPDSPLPPPSTPPAPPPPPGTSPEPGADTIMYLFGRDGVTLLGSNNNDEAGGGNPLDSRILFAPTVDGFYYVQVKNIGDIGNQFIQYDLKLAVCAPADKCGVPAGSGDTGSTETFAASSPAFSPAAPSAPNPNSSDSLFLGASVPPGFADLAFARVWQRNDQPVAQQRVARGWLWGPQPRIVRTERYAQAAGGQRQVQYFDKGRMEINNPRGDRSSRWFVTSGLLVVELTSGRMQTGDGEYTQLDPLDRPIAGDPDNPSAPTYASFAGVTDRYPGDRSGQLVTESINRDGLVGAYAGAPRDETRLVSFVRETGHNIPAVFWDELNASGQVYEGGRYRSAALVDWVFTLGYPISEPYWGRVRVGGSEHDVLIQAFQRRVLTYTPDAPSGWRVQMGNVGRDYYRWRYGEDLPA